MISRKGLWLVALLVGACAIAPAQTVNISEYAAPAVYSLGIAAGPDGALWFTEGGRDKIGRITTAGVYSEYSLPRTGSYPDAITLGPDGALWFTEQGGIGRITTAGVVTEYPLNSSFLGNITAGPDGALWFADGENDNIVRITTAGLMTTYAVPTDGFPSGIVAGPDGALWFTESAGNKIGRVTTAGVFSEYSVPTAGSYPTGITAGPDGALWFIESGIGPGYGGKIGRITTAGAITEYPMPTPSSRSFVITAGPDGALWFTEEDLNKIARITTSGVITEYAVLAPRGITAGPDGAIWFIGGNFTIGRAGLIPSPGPPVPSAGSGLNQTFVFTFSDQAGRQDFDVVNILISNSLDARNSCYLAYKSPTDMLFLVNDPGTALLPDLVLNGAGSVGNSQCTVIGAGSSAARSGNTLTLTLNLSFSASFAGNKVIYLAARDFLGGTSGWQALGTWNVPGVTPTGPSVKGMSPASSDNLVQTYTFTFSDTNGWQDIAVANVLINSALDGRHACFVAFVPTSAASGSVFLVDDAGDAAGPYSGVVLPGTGSTGNSQCAIAGAGSSVNAAGNTLTLTLAIRFIEGFGGNQIVYAAARSLTLTSGWQAVGSVTVP